MVCLSTSLFRGKGASRHAYVYVNTHHQSTDGLPARMFGSEVHPDSHTPRHERCHARCAAGAKFAQHPMTRPPAYGLVHLVPHLARRPPAPPLGGPLSLSATAPLHTLASSAPTRLDRCGDCPLDRSAFSAQLTLRAPLSPPGALPAHPASLIRSTNDMPTASSEDSGLPLI